MNCSTHLHGSRYGLSFALPLAVTREYSQSTALHCDGMRVVLRQHGIPVTTRLPVLIRNLHSELASEKLVVLSARDRVSRVVDYRSVAVAPGKLLSTHKGVTEPRAPASGFLGFQRAL